MGTFDSSEGEKLGHGSTDKNEAESHCNQGVIYWRQGKLDEAIREFKEAIGSIQTLP